MPGEPDRLGQSGRDARVAEGVGMQAVLAPEAWVRGDGVLRQVHQNRPGTRAARAEPLVEALHTGGESRGERHYGRQVREGNGQHRCAGASQCSLHGFDVCQDLREVNLAAHDIVGPREDRGDVGAHGERGGKLLLKDLPSFAAAHGKVGILNAAVGACEMVGEAVGPAAESTAAIGIVESFGGAVAQRDVPGEARRGIGVHYGRRRTSSSPSKVTCGQRCSIAAMKAALSSGEIWTVLKRS